MYGSAVDFVGGTVTDSDGRVLLVRRATNDAHMAGLWSLPGGARREAESDREAVTRKLLGETGLEVEVGPPVREVKRLLWQGTAYHARKVGGHVQGGRDAGIADSGFFAIDELPERTVLEARIAILSHWLGSSTSVSAAEYSMIVDGLFSSLFYSYLEPTLYKLELEHLPVLSWAITHTPLRKFKSAIPFLLSDMTDTAKEYALIAEVVFALCTVLDDLCDRRTERYGSATVHEEFGYPQSIAILFGATESLRHDLSIRYGTAYAEIISDSLLKCARSQLQRFSDQKIDIPSYFDNCSSRNDFLGRAWQAGLRASGRNREAEFLYDLHKDAIVASQMLNDYYDIARGEYRDYRNGVKSYYTLKLEAELSDRGELQSLLARRDEPASLAEFRRLIDHHDIARKIRDDIRNALGDNSERIQRSDLSIPHKIILTGWNDIPLMNVLDEDGQSLNFHSDAVRFVDGLDLLCRTLS